ncbi:MAG: hypothetical protein ACK410_00685 [Acinetobacter sp.]
MLSLKIYKFVIFSIKNKSKVMGGTGLGGTGTGTGTEADNDKEKKPTQKFLSKSTSFTKDKS